MWSTIDQHLLLSNQLQRGNVMLTDNYNTHIAWYHTTVILLNTKYVELQQVLYVPGLKSPILLVCQWCQNFGCGFHADEHKCILYLPIFSLGVDDFKDCLLNYAPIGYGINHNKFHFRDQLSHILHNKAHIGAISKYITLLDYHQTSSITTPTKQQYPRYTPKSHKHYIKYLNNLLSSQVHIDNQLPNICTYDTPRTCKKGRDVIIPGKISCFLSYLRLGCFWDIELMKKTPWSMTPESQLPLW